MSKTKFTDDDLKLLKNEISFRLASMQDPLIPLKAEFLGALLARLEAAEVIARLYEQEWPTLEITRNWRKAAGK